MCHTHIRGSAPIHSLENSKIHDNATANDLLMYKNKTESRLLTSPFAAETLPFASLREDPRKMKGYPCAPKASAIPAFRGKTSLVVCRLRTTLSGERG